MLLSGIVALLLVLTAEAKVGNNTGPLCAPTTECLSHYLIFSNAKLEVRYYYDAMWASANSTFHDLRNADETLMEYFGGANENGTMMAMASPSVLRVPFKDYMENGTVTFAVLLTAQYQNQPPTPTNNAVVLHASSAIIAYTMPSSEFTVAGVNATVVALSNYLSLSGVLYNQDYFYVAFHNSGVTEVWFVGDVAHSSSGDWESFSISAET